MKVKIIRSMVERKYMGKWQYKKAWLIVNEDDMDLVQPWFDTKAEAKLHVKMNGWEIIGEQ